MWQVFAFLNNFWVIVDGCGWFFGWLWMVLGGCDWLGLVVDGCGWLWLGAYFSITRLLFTKFGVTKMELTISSSKLNWAELLSSWTKIFMKALHSHYNMHWISFTYITTWQGRWNKFRMSLNVFFFFKRVKRKIVNLWFQPKCCYFGNDNDLLC